MNPHPDKKQQADAFKILKELITTCPEEWLIRLFEDHTGIDFTPDFVAMDVESHLSVLEQMAAIGSQDAVENLAAIGIRVSSFLEDLAGKQSDKVQENVNAGRFTHCAMDPNVACRDSYRDMSKAVAILLGASVEDLKKSVDEVDAQMPTPFRLRLATGMFTQRIRRRRRKKDPMVSVDDCPPTGSESNPSLNADFAAEAKMHEVNLLFNRLLEHRAQHLARETVRRVLATSKSWPMVVPSPAHDRNRTANIEKRIKELGLGAGLTYKLGNKPDGKSGVRDMTDYVFLALDRKRTEALTLSQSDRAEYEAYKSGGTEGNMDESRLRALKRWNPMTHWLRKAALLPEPAIKHLDQWVEAGMSYLTFRASRASYNKIVRQGEVARECEKQGLLNRLRKSCTKCAGRIEDAGCPACKAVKLEIDDKYQTWMNKELQLWGKWGRGVDQEFEDFDWPNYFSDRARNKSSKSVAREKLKNGFKVIFRSSESLPGHQHT